MDHNETISVLVVESGKTPYEKQISSGLESLQREVGGYVVNLELPELKEMVSLLRRSSNNLNQIAKRMNETGRIYDADIGDVLENQERLWQAASDILSSLAKLQ